MKIPIPEWARGLFNGQKQIGFSLPIVAYPSPPSLPGLATGGDIIATPGGTAIRVAEAGQDETIVNRGLVNSTLSEVLKLLNDTNSSTIQPAPLVYITVNPSEGMDEALLARKIKKEFRKSDRR